MAPALPRLAGASDEQAAAYSRFVGLLSEVCHLFARCASYATNVGRPLASLAGGKGGADCELDALLTSAEERLAQVEASPEAAELAAWSRTLPSATPARALAALVRVGVNVSLAFRHLVAGTRPASEYMSLVGDASASVRPHLRSLLGSPLGREVLEGLTDLLRPVTFFVGLQERLFAAVHMDSSFGHTWMPAWRWGNLTREMLDTEAWDKLFARALAELAAGFAHVAPWGEWWPHSGTLISLLRHGALTGPLTEGRVDASIGKDMEVLALAQNEEDWETLAGRLTDFWRRRFRWHCTALQLYARRFPGLPPRNDSLSCRAPPRIHLCEPHERFCRYSPDFQITAYFRDVQEESLYVHKVPEAVAAAVGCHPPAAHYLRLPIAKRAAQAGCQGEAVDSRVGRLTPARDGGWFIRHQEPFGHWGGAIPWRLVYPLGRCAAGGAAAAGILAAGVPCPARALEVLAGTVDGGGCLALPLLTEDRRADDQRNHELAARGLVPGDWDVLRARALELERRGFASFARHLEGPVCQEQHGRLLAAGSLPAQKSDTVPMLHIAETLRVDDFDDRQTENPMEFFKNQLSKFLHAFCEAGKGRDPQINISILYWNMMTMADTWFSMPESMHMVGIVIPPEWGRGGILAHRVRGPLLMLQLEHQLELTLVCLLISALHVLIFGVLSGLFATLAVAADGMLRMVFGRVPPDGAPQPPSRGQVLADLLRVTQDAGSKEAADDVLLGLLHAGLLFELYDRIWRVAGAGLTPGDSRWCYDCLERLMAWAVACAAQWEMVWAGRDACALAGLGASLPGLAR